MPPTRPAQAGELQVPELALRLGMSEELVTELRLVSDGPWDCALRSMLLEACGYREFRLNATSAAISIHGSECGYRRRVVRGIQFRIVNSVSRAKLWAGIARSVDPLASTCNSLDALNI